MAAEPIKVKGVVKNFGTTRALDGIDLEIGPGELFFLLGASGCGKTTLLRCIAGLEQPCAGSIHFGQRDVTAVPPHKREAALVFQSYALWPHMDVRGNVAFGLEERKVPKAEIRRRVDEALEMVKLGGLANRGIDQLSGGQQQRVSLARALVVRPKCLLLDEPLSNLDAQLRVEMRREIRRIVKENGLTAVYVTHDQEEALAMADRMAVLARGRIAQAGTPEEVYRSPRSAHVAGFIGETNLIKGTLRDRGAGGASVECGGGILLSGRVSDQSWSPRPGEEVLVSIRPEAWRLGVAGGGQSVTGRITERSYLGQRIQYWIDTPLGSQQVVEMNPHELLQPGDQPVNLQARDTDIVVLRGEP